MNENDIGKGREGRGNPYSLKYPLGTNPMLETVLGMLETAEIRWEVLRAQVEEERQRGSKYNDQGLTSRLAELHVHDVLARASEQLKFPLNSLYLDRRSKFGKSRARTRFGRYILEEETRGNIRAYERVQNATGKLARGRVVAEIDAIAVFKDLPTVFQIKALSASSKKHAEVLGKSVADEKINTQLAAVHDEFETSAYAHVTVVTQGILRAQVAPGSKVEGYQMAGGRFVVLPMQNEVFYREARRMLGLDPNSPPDSTRRQ